MSSREVSRSSIVDINGTRTWHVEIAADDDRASLQYPGILTRPAGSFKAKAKSLKAKAKVKNLKVKAKARSLKAKARDQG